MDTTNRQSESTMLPMVPTFTPTDEEFREPLAYFRTLMEAGMKTGIVKIIPPASWHPEFDLDVKRKFESYRQSLHTLQDGESFASGDDFTQNEYRAYASQFQKDYFEAHPDVMTKYSTCMIQGDSDAASIALEEEYWKVVDGHSSEKITVDYANNMDTKKYGSPFRNSHVKRPWDLNSLIKDKDGILGKVGERIAGVTTPWLYFGCMFATFCWHVEDHFLYSLNYMHHGAAKVWYAIPEQGALVFESVLKKTIPERFKKEPDLLHQLVTMISPHYLKKEGLDVYRAVQHKGEIIVTFPRAYHAGFSHGWNCAEAVNFASLNWLPFGRMAVESYMQPGSGRAPTFSHHRLLWDLCQDAVSNSSYHEGKNTKTLPNEADVALLCSELQMAIDQEYKKRAEFRKLGMAETTVSKPWDGEPFQCMICKDMHFFSFSLCPCGAQSAGTVCLNHALDTFCHCEVDKKVLCIQVSDKDLSRILRKLKKKGEACSGIVPSTPGPHASRSRPAKSLTGSGKNKLGSWKEKRFGSSSKVERGLSSEQGLQQGLKQVEVELLGESKRRKIG